jgi:hypothetical protein
LRSDACIAYQAYSWHLRECHPHIWV